MTDLSPRPHPVPTDISNPRNTFPSRSFLPKPYVRYLGFESIPEGRRLRFRVKQLGEAGVEVTCEVLDKDFRGTLGVSIQDAPLMAYEKLVEMLAREHSIEPTLLLTFTDAANYVSRHTPRKAGQSKVKEPDVAA